MSVRLILGIALFCIGTTGVILANMFLLVMIGEINRKKPDGQTMSYFGFTYPKLIRIFSQYQHHYPRGRHRTYAMAAFGVSIMAWLAIIVCAARRAG